ncbi:MAG: flagellar assembly protein FliW [Bdellovibrionota bacterium]|jgi:flagellar assembly factor FliW
MSNEAVVDSKNITFQSSRFGEVVVPEDSVLEFPVGIIGFPNQHQYVMLEHKPPFAWLHAVDEPNLAFVVIDALELGEGYSVQPPIGDKDIDLKEDDEYAVLIIVTIRPDPSMTTANLKAPLFVNLRNRKGVQVIFDDARLSTRHLLWKVNDKGEQIVAEPDIKQDK